MLNKQRNILCAEPRKEYLPLKKRNMLLGEYFYETLQFFTTPLSFSVEFEVSVGKKGLLSKILCSRLYYYDLIFSINRRVAPMCATYL